MTSKKEDRYGNDVDGDDPDVYDLDSSFDWGGEENVEDFNCSDADGYFDPANYMHDIANVDVKNLDEAGDNVNAGSMVFGPSGRAERRKSLKGTSNVRARQLARAGLRAERNGSPKWKLRRCCKIVPNVGMMLATRWKA